MSIKITDDVHIDTARARWRYKLFSPVFHWNCGYYNRNYVCETCGRKMTKKEMTAYRLWEFNNSRFQLSKVA